MHVIAEHPDWERLQSARREIAAEREKLEARLRKERADYETAVLAAVSAGQVAPPFVDNSGARGALDSRLRGVESAERLFLRERGAELEAEIDRRQDEILDRARSLVEQLSGFAHELEQLRAASVHIVQGAGSTEHVPDHRDVRGPQVSVESLVDAARFGKRPLSNGQGAGAPRRSLVR
jgi:hypothetical protein